MTFLGDVNFWLALAVDDHVHHMIATDWLSDTPDEDLAFCRVTQKGLLRLLTNSTIMKSDVFTASEAWSAYDALISNQRMRFEHEPPGMEHAWRDLTRDSRKGRDFWTDAYLTAFAMAAGFIVLTFDRELARRAGRQAKLLAAPNVIQ